MLNYSAFKGGIIRSNPLVFPRASGKNAEHVETVCQRRPSRTRPKLLDQVRAVSRLMHYSVRTVTTTLGCLMEPGDHTLVVRAADGEGDV